MTPAIAPDIPDGELVHRAKAGELEAFEELTARHERQVYTLAFRMLRHEHDAQDVTQQTFLSALEHLHGFREDAAFRTWLLRIAAHAALKVIRKRKRLPTVSLDQPLETHGETDGSPIPRPEYIADWKHSPEELVHANKTRQLLEQTLQELDEKHRLVFLLRDVEGLSVKETARALRLSEANVKVRLLRARLQLRERLTRILGDPATAVRRSTHRH